MLKPRFFIVVPRSEVWFVGRLFEWSNDLWVIDGLFDVVGIGVLIDGIMVWENEECQIVDGADLSAQNLLFNTRKSNSWFSKYYYYLRQKIDVRPLP